MPATDLHAVVTEFFGDGELCEAVLFGNGHIHDSYRITVERGGVHEQYVLQRHNLTVFPNPAAIMANIRTITAHLQQHYPQQQTLTIIQTVKGADFAQSAQGEVWRCFEYVPNSYSVTHQPSLQQVQAAATGFGAFQAELADFDPQKLQETIPDFHHTPKRYQALLAAFGADVAGRGRAVQPEFDLIQTRAGELDKIVVGLENGSLPLRVTHNDTKLNNVLLDKDTGQALCVVDLDTVMPGSLLYDFGDGIRSAAKTAAEDALDPTTMAFDLDVYRAFTAGFLAPVRGLLTPAEVALLPYSAWLLTLETVIRFLADYLAGDVYFKTAHPEHNLQRARAQMQLLLEMEAARPEMERIVFELMEQE